MTIEDILVEEIKRAGGLKIKEAQEEFVGRIINVVRECDYANPREAMHRVFFRYLESQWMLNPEDAERLFAGIMAFIWVNLYEEPYQPLFMFPSKEHKKWWQFWR